VIGVRREWTTRGTPSDDERALEVDTVDDVEGIVISVRELDGIAYGLRELPMQLRSLGSEAFRAGYLAAIRGESPEDGSHRFGDAVLSVAAGC
jgi:hypothetical protein